MRLASGGAAAIAQGVLQSRRYRIQIFDPTQGGVWGSSPQVKILDAGTKLVIGGF